MRGALIPTLLLALSGGPSACTERLSDAEGPVYLGSEVYDLGGDLHGFLVSVRGVGDDVAVQDYVTCVVAGYAVEKDQGFARRVRVYVNEEGGVWSADAVYSITPALPRGAKTIDADVTAADCALRGIPTV